jgi:predicted phosphodiesterase
VPTGGACGFCSLPEKIRDEAVERWRKGDGSVKLAKWLEAKGFPVSQAIVQNCLSARAHYGQRSITSSAAASDRLGKIAELLERSNIDPADIGKVQSIKISEWQGLTKNEQGEAELHDLKGAAIVLTPAWAEGPRWPLIAQAAPCMIAGPKPRKRKAGKWRTAVVLPDSQVGYRRDVDTATLDPFHDEAALAAAMRVVQTVDPDLVVHLGDLLDFAPFSTYEQEAGFALTVQPALDRAHRYLAETQAAAPRARQVLLEGNHDRRLQKAIVRNALSAFGIRRADKPDEWPVLSVPYLLRLDELAVEYVGGYPAGIYWLSDRLACIHGHKVRSAGNTAAAVVDDERISVIFGHVHRLELQHRTRRVRDGHRTSLAASPGCLCRIDGAVPSTKGSTDPMGRPIATAENWQHGLAVVTYQEGDGPFSLELVPIHDGEVIFRGAAA